MVIDMGLDGVELVLRIEDEFSILLSDEEAAAARTVGDLYELILSKIKTTPDCLSSKAFYRVRKALVDTLGIPRRSIRPATDLEPLFPRTQRKVLWSAVSDAVGLSIPRLQYSNAWKSRFIQIALVFATSLVVTGGIAFHVSLGMNFGRQIGGLLYWAFATFLWIALFTLSDVFLLRCATFLRSEISVVNAGELAQMVLALNPSAYTPEAQTEQLSKDQVWVKLTQIICDQLGLDPDEVVPHATFIDDLGVC